MTAVSSEKRKKRKLLPAALCAVAALGILVAAVYAGWYFSPEQKLLRALEADDPARVQQLYAQVEEVPEAFAGLVCGKLESLASEYIRGGTDYAAADRTLGIYEAIHADGTQEALASCRQLLERVRVSREAYVRGQSLEAAKDYPAAMESYAQVTGEDLWGWENARNKLAACREAYREQILHQAAELADAQAYADAVNKLHEGLAVLENDAELLAQVQTYTQAEADKQRRELLAQAQALASVGDYPGAIALLESEEDEQLCQAWLSFRQEYADVTLTAAEEAFSLEGYEAALAVIENCLLTLPENEALLERKAWYESYRPEYLSGCALQVTEGSKLYLDQHKRDWKGNSYTCSLAVNKGSITVQTNGEYALLTGTLACPEGYAEDAYRTGAAIEIRADGAVIYRSPVMAADSVPRYFELDISGVEQLTITWTCEGRNIWKNWGDRATVFDAALHRHSDL